MGIPPPPYTLPSHFLFFSAYYQLCCFSIRLAFSSTVSLSFLLCVLFVFPQCSWPRSSALPPSLPSFLFSLISFYFFLHLSALLLPQSLFSFYAHSCLSTTFLISLSLSSGQHVSSSSLAWSQPLSSTPTPRLPSTLIPHCLWLMAPLFWKEEGKRREKEGGKCKHKYIRALKGAHAWELHLQLCSQEPQQTVHRCLSKWGHSKSIQTEQRPGHTEWAASVKLSTHTPLTDTLPLTQRQHSSTFGAEPIKRAVKQTTQTLKDSSAQTLLRTRTEMPHIGNIQP